MHDYDGDVRDRAGFDQARGLHRAMMTRTRWLDAVAGVVLAVPLAWGTWYLISTSHYDTDLSYHEGSPVFGVLCGLAVFIVGVRMVYQFLRGQRARRFTGSC